MNEDSPLGDIREQLEATGNQQEKDTEDAKVDQADKEAEVEEEDEEGPAFSFDEAKQSPLYPHRDRWEQLEDAKFEMQVFLRQHGVRDVQGRELDDAILRHAIDNSDEVAELVLESRGIEIDK